MAARPIASPKLTFGLVTVPVSIYTSSESEVSISFNMIHADCGTRVKQQLFCPKDERVVERDEIVKGYPISKTQYVLFDKEEIKALEQQKSELIEIKEFVPAPTVPRVYYDRLYYLGPDKGGDRAYHLLARAMVESGLVAIAKYAARGKMYLVMIRPLEGGLVMEQLKYADEIRSLSEVPLGNAEVREEELTLARQWVQQVAKDTFDASKYQDEVRARTMELIQKKIEGEDITQVETVEAGPKILDLMEALKASLAQREGDKGEAAGATPRSPSRTRKAAGGS